MARSTDDLRRELVQLRQENTRLQAVERELAVALESLRSSEERLRLAVEAAHIGVWEWDIATDRVTWDARNHDVFGLAHGSFAGTTAAFFELVHADDRPRLQEAIADALERAAPYRNEFRIVGPAGDIRWIANLGQVYRDDDGRPLRMIGVVYDITARSATPAPASPPPRRKTVLVADDEAAVRRLATRMLASKGYAVLQAASGAEALEVARAYGGAIDLLLTDVRMPVMTGWELARQLRSDRPAVRVLLMSGYTEHPLELEVQGGTDSHFLEKPFSADALIRKVQSVLEPAEPQ